MDLEAIFQIESEDIFQKVSECVLTSLFYPGPDAQLESKNIYDKAKNELRTIISECNFDFQKIMTLFHDKQYDQVKFKYFINLLEQNWSELLVTALNYYQSDYGETLINFDWILKFVFGTSELKTLKYPLLQLILQIINKNGEQNKLIYDVNRDMLTKLIDVLENNI